MTATLRMLLLALALPAATGARADCPAAQWPCAPVEVVSHASAGGGTDTTIRAWRPAAAARLDEPLRVVYRRGTGARAAHETLAGRPADGHTLVAVTETHLYTIARGQSPFPDITALRGVARAIRDPSVVLVDAQRGAADYAALVAASREAPLLWGVAHIGGTEHIGIRRWARAAGAGVRVIPFGGGGDTVAALEAGAVDAILANLSEARGVLASGRARALAVLQPRRAAALPGIPTSHELGHPVTVATTRGYAVPAATPEPVVRRIEAALLAALRSEGYRSYLRGLGLDPARQILGADAWQREMRLDYAAAVTALRALEDRGH